MGKLEPCGNIGKLEMRKEVGRKKVKGKSVSVGYKTKLTNYPKINHFIPLWF